MPQTSYNLEFWLTISSTTGLTQRTLVGVIFIWILHSPRWGAPRSHMFPYVPTIEKYKFLPHLKLYPTVSGALTLR